MCAPAVEPAGDDPARRLAARHRAAVIAATPRRADQHQQWRVQVQATTAYPHCGVHGTMRYLSTFGGALHTRARSIRARCAGSCRQAREGEFAIRPEQTRTGSAESSDRVRSTPVESTFHSFSFSCHCSFISRRRSLTWEAYRRTRPRPCARTRLHARPSLQTAYGLMAMAALLPQSRDLQG